MHLDLDLEFRLAVFAHVERLRDAAGVVAAADLNDGVIFRGQRVPIVGAISMDMLTVDVSDLQGVEPGDEVVIVGRQGPESWQQIDVREMAAAIGTIPYEIVCRVGARIERHYD